MRAKISGTASCPRLSVFKSNMHIYAQLINDASEKTLFSASDKDFKKTKKTMKVVAYEVGKALAKKAADGGVKNAIFDRGGYKFHGAVAELARGAREGGLKF